MSKMVELLDCTLRDGAYITESHFGMTAIMGIIKRMQDANVDIIECGWLKDSPHEAGSSFFHMPDDLLPYLSSKSDNSLYVLMIDWDRYDLNHLPECNHKSIDAIRIVFPHEKYKEGIAVGKKIKEKGYQIFFQAANTLAYTDEELSDLATEVNSAMPSGLSIVDTFGAMYMEDLDRIVNILNPKLHSEIRLGFHSHNNQQLSFALTMHFVEMLQGGAPRHIIVDSSLCGMGRGAGNAPTELVASFLNRKCQSNYDMNVIMDAIDMYMGYFQKRYTWGYSIPYFIAGMYCCHVNNITYLLKNHRTNAQDMRNIIASMSPDERKKYDYDRLEEKYMENQSCAVDDSEVIEALRSALLGREVLLIAPGKSVDLKRERIKAFISEHHPVIIGVNAVNVNYDMDYLFFVNKVRYDYAKEIYPDTFYRTQKILLSNIKTIADKNEVIVSFNHVVKRGWIHFDNAMITCLRLMNRLHMKRVNIAGFDGFKHQYNESYADAALPTLNPENKWDELNDEIRDMFLDFENFLGQNMELIFLTESIFHQEKGRQRVSKNENKGF